MKRYVSLLFLALTTAGLWAQNDSQNALTTWFLEARFMLADQDRDALLDPEELSRFPEEFGYFLDDLYFTLSDENADGKLSFRETQSRLKVAAAYRHATEANAVASLQQRFPELVKPQIAYVKSQPALAQALFSNLHWLNKHPQIATALLHDTEWLQSQPKVVASLQRNLCWLASHPEDAKHVYKHLRLGRQGRMLVSWRAAHQSYLRKHTAPTADVFLTFLPR